MYKQLLLALGIGMLLTSCAKPMTLATAQQQLDGMKTQYADRNLHASRELTQAMIDNQQHLVDKPAAQKK